MRIPSWMGCELVPSLEEGSLGPRACAAPCLGTHIRPECVQVGPWFCSADRQLHAVLSVQVPMDTGLLSGLLAPCVLWRVPGGQAVFSDGVEAL